MHSAVGTPCSLRAQTAKSDPRNPNPRRSPPPVTITTVGFSPLDYVILILYLSVTVILAARLGRGQHTLNDYFLGGGRMPWWAISMSIVATETSTLTFIGVPAIAYGGNLTFLQLSFGYLLGRILVSLLLMPGYFERRIETAYEVLNRRYGQGVRLVSASVFQLTRLLADGVRLFATAPVFFSTRASCE